MLKISSQIRQLIRAALKEDIGKGDVTSTAFVPQGTRGEAQIHAKQNGIMCGGPIASEAFRMVNPKLKIVQKVREGVKIHRGDTAFVIQGEVRAILKAERVVLNFLAHLSGIATLTNQFVKKVKGTKAQILDTRKTTPLLRELEKYAVCTGGGKNHRFGLYDQVLIKENHWQFIKSVEELNRKMKQAKKKAFTEIEVTSLAELKKALSCRPHAVLLDNFSLKLTRKTVKIVQAHRPRPLLEVSGGINLDNVREYAKTGVDRISIGALTHSAPALDFSLAVA